ncbi:olfactory receptor 10V1-like [Budorcas taxicolor]|uniref:olfactory receptor 10V1-like n=1 Tax=Budorcas taxicolor TaxID=37181 RepID=UPI002283E7F5|nr:olfactory receptor 10V1-like [Budorcas taxicolor]
MCVLLLGLALLEIAHFPGAVPLTLASTLPTGRTPLSLPGCGSRMCFPIILGGLTVSCWLPALRTGTGPRVTPALGLVLSWQLREQMALGSLGLGFLLALPLTTCICLFPFCGHDDTYHFFCDTPAVTRGHQAASVPLACPLQPPLPPDPLSRREDGVGPGRAPGLLHLPLPPHGGSPAVRLLTYLRPSTSSSPGDGRAGSVVYTFFSPLLNPWI